MSLHSKLIGTPFLIIVTLITAAVCSGQSRRFQEEWRWSRFGLDDGLPSLRIESITESQDGTLWVMTGKGPAWFDGFKWNSVKIDLISPLDTRKPIQAFGATSILVSAGARRLLRVDKTGAFDLILPKRLRKHVIMGVLGDEKGGCRLLMFRPGSGEGIRFLVYQGQEFSEIVLPEDLSRAKRVRMVAGSGGEVFFVNLEKAWAWSKGRFSPAVTQPEPGWRIAGITSDGKGHIGRWLLSRTAVDEGNAGLKPNGLAVDRRETALWERAADAASHRETWRAARGLVGQADLPLGCSIVVLEGRESQILEKGRWKTLDPLPPNFLGATCLFWTKRGQLCVGSVRGLSICQYDSALWTRCDIDHLETGRIRKVLGDRHRQLWVIGDKGLFSFSGDTLLQPGLHGGINHELLAEDLIEDARGRIWASDRNGKLYRRNVGTWEVVKTAGDRPELVSATFLGFDGTGPWIRAESMIDGLARDRLLRWNGSDFVDWSPWEIAVNGVFHDMVESRDGTLWFAGVHGISKFARGEWEHWNRDRGLIRNFVDSLALDTSGSLWFLHAGVALGQLLDSGRVEYANHSGLADYDCPRSLERGADGRLWTHTDTRLRLLPSHAPSPGAGSEEGSPRLRDWVSIDLPPGWAQKPYRQLHPTRDLLVFLDTEGRLATFNIRVGDSRPPVLELGEPGVHIGGVRMAWVARSWYGAIPAAMVLTRHRLDNGPWSNWSTEHRLDIWNPPAGPHQIHLQARNRLGRSGLAFVSNVFEVPSPFWMRPAFYLPISALLSLLLVTIFLWTWNTRRHALALEGSRKKLETMAEMSPVGILQADHRGMIQFKNSRGEEIVGMDLSGRQPQDYLTALHEEDRDRVRREWLATTNAGSDFESRFRFRHADGTTKWVMGQAVPEHDEKGRVVAYVGTLTDITDMELAAAERKRLEERLVQAQKLESVGQLAGGIAHDFNNLLQVILGYTDFLDERLSVDGNEDQDLAQIKHSAERATELTRQLLAFSRKQQGRPRPLSPAAMVQEVLTMMRRVLPESISIEFQPTEDIGTICMDGNQFDQVILNLCLNARDAMPEGGVLKITLENVEMLSTDIRSGGLVPPGRYVLLRVIDTGTGMSEEVSKRLFEPFFTTKEPGKGTGLGMAMVYGIVRQNEGAVEVESEVGVGTELRIYLPRIEGQIEPRETLLTGSYDGRGETILIAEDEELVRELARTMLERAGYRVLTAVDGEEAIEKFQQHRDEISVVLLDAIMPRCGGREVYERLRKMDDQVAFLFSSGHPANQLPEAFLEENRLVLIPKPYKAKQLLKEVRGVLDRQQLDS